MDMMLKGIKNINCDSSSKTNLFQISFKNMFEIKDVLEHFTQDDNLRFYIISAFFDYLHIHLDIMNMVLGTRLPLYEERTICVHDISNIDEYLISLRKYVDSRNLLNTPIGAYMFTLQIVDYPSDTKVDDITDIGQIYNIPKVELEYTSKDPFLIIS